MPSIMRPSLAKMIGVNRSTLKDGKARDATSFLDRLALVEFAEGVSTPATVASLLAAAFARAEQPDEIESTKKLG
jgi:hypothetical protein